MMKTGNQGEKTGTLQKHYITVKKEGMSMTLRELYSSIGEDYEQALRVLRVEKLVDKHIRKFTQNGVIEALLAAGKEWTLHSCSKHRTRRRETAAIWD